MDGGDVQMGAKLAGVVLGQLTGVDPYNQVMSVLNGSQSAPDYTAYFAAISAQLNQIESAVDEVAADVQTVMAQQTQILLSITDAKLQTVLVQYESDAATINQAYLTLSSALAALQSTDSKTKLAGAQLITEITSTGQIKAVETAMLDICTALLGDGIFKGVLNYMPDLLDASVRGLGGTNSSAISVTICGRPCYDSFWLLNQFYPQYTSEIKNSIVPLFSSALTVLQKGITLLELAYLGTIQQTQLSTHYTNVQQIGTYIEGFWAAITDPTTLGNAMTATFHTVAAQNIDLHLRQMCWAHWNVMTPDPNDDGGVANYPFPGNYAGWVTVATKASAQPPGYSSRTPLMASVAPNFTFGTSVMQFMFADAGDYVQFGMAYGFGAGTLVHYPIPTVAEFFGTGGAPTTLSTMTGLITSTGLLQSQTLPPLKAAPEAVNIIHPTPG